MGNRKHFALIEGLDPDGRYIDGKGSNAPRTLGVVQHLHL